MESTQPRSSRGFSLNLTPLNTENSTMSTATSSFDPSAYTPTHAYSKHTYLAHKSAPSTPGILSHHHPSRHSSTRLTSLTPLTSVHKSCADLSRSSPHSPNSARTRRQQKPNMKLQDQDSEWLYRAGATIASEVEESKGQAWLTQRASSTSLAGMAGGDSSDSEDDAPSRQSHGLWDGRGMGRGVTPWEARRRALEMDARNRSRVNSARPSRVGSRVGSTRVSRRNSGIGAEGLGMSEMMMTGKGVEDDYFGTARGASEEVDVEDAVDAIHAVEDEGVDLEDDEEVVRLMKEKGFGLRSVVGQVLAWTGLAGTEPHEHEQRDQGVSLSDVSAQARIADSKLAQVEEVDIDPAPVDGSFKDDIVWLLGVAGKILF